MNRKILVVTSASGVKEGLRPKIKLSGSWLNDVGFYKNMLLSIECKNENILFKPCDLNKMNSFDFSKRILKDNNNGILHVKEEWRKNNNNSLSITISGFWLEKFGFNIGDVIVVDYDCGIINVQRLEINSISSKISN